MTAIRPMTPEDWAAVETIYREGIATGHATFEAEPPTREAFDAGKLDVGRLVAVDGEQILGWAALSKVSTRPVYRGVVEHSVYIAAAARGRGVGSTLLAALIAAANDADLWTIQSSIFPENTASLALHDRAGFRRVGIRERIAQMTYGPEAGRWRDTILIERRRP
ncbi:phosphinothricin acetyltransferase [Rathayibacter sp. PhB152]|uniref:GNAT family N-acetyltransferase n=1 Tax=Rathayibacter sp. PhB152 TaxID=2485190 RepID=UPI000F4BA7B6|nr:GNAT family N-acetyltransferase [Rathayibacter sp. PhB152]ROQ52547.1 phosphinothricin acetyltransferase [Rathayibacter sp. PhB152]